MIDIYRDAETTARQPRDALNCTEWYAASVETGGRRTEASGQHMGNEKIQH